MNFFIPLQISDLQLKIQNFEDNSVDKSAVARLEGKIRDLENKLELEISQKHKLEVRSCLKMWGLVHDL